MVLLFIPQLVVLEENDMKLLNELHKEPGFHKSLVNFHHPKGGAFGWSYEELGWNMIEGGIVP